MTLRSLPASLKSAFALFATAACILVSSPSLAQQPQRAKTPDFAELAGSIKMQTGATLVKAENGVPQLVLGVKGNVLVASQPKAMSLRMVAQRTKDFFAMTASSLGFLPENAQLAATDAITVGQSLNTIVTLSYNGIPVRDRKASISIGSNSGELLMIRNSLPAIAPSAATAKISTQRVLEKIAPTLAAASKIIKQPALVYLANKDNTSLRLAYEVRVSEPQHLWRYTFDASNGSLIEKKDLIVYCADPAHDHYDEVLLDTTPMFAPAETVTGKVTGNVLFHSPFKPDTTVHFPFVKVVVNGRTTYADADGNFTATNATYPLAITSSLESRFFKLNRADGELDGKLTSTFTLGTPDLMWGSTMGTLGERSAYTSVHRAYQHVKSFDPSFTTLDQKMDVNINVNGECNAFYDPGARTLNFFPKVGNCSNTAEVADVVYHEYGHHYHHVRYQERGTDVVSSALGEAVADILSNFIRDNPIIGEGFRGVGTILRTSKNTRRWPEGVAADPHTTGEILTGAIWDLRLAIGLEHSAFLFHEALKSVPDATAGDNDVDAALEAFTDVLLAYLLADDDDNDLQNGSPNSSKIIAAFEKHGIGLSNLVALDLYRIADQDTIATEYSVDVSASYSGVLGAIDRDSVKLYYSVNGGPYAVLNVSHNAGNAHVGSIPKLPAGSVVKYYSTARTTIEQGSIVRTPRSGSYTFLVGFKQRYSDNGENELGHEYGIESDDAPRGIWERAEPYGTIWIEDYFQQDSDRTANGTWAYITGNSNGINGSTDPLEDALYDWNFQGTRKTTLQTASFDLRGAKSAMLKFYYYHRSEQVFSATVNTFRVALSVNDGMSWKTLYSSTDINPGWTSVIVPMNLGTGSYDKARLRFTANAANGTIVEAGVDDIEILEPLNTNPVTGDVDEENAIRLDLSTYPNPVSNGTFTFSYSLPQASIVMAELKNVMGTAVWSANGELKQMGPHSQSVQADLPSGTYWLQLSTSMGNFYKQVHVVK